MTISRELFEAFLRALNARDFDEIASLVGPDVKFKSLFAAANGAQPYTGVEGLRRSAQEVDAIWEGWHQEIVDYRQVSDAQAVIVMRSTGRAKGSGVPLDSLTGNVLTWLDDEGWEMVAYADPRDAFKSLGLRG
jgi:hypothetical protein